MTKSPIFLRKKQFLPKFMRKFKLTRFYLFCNIYFMFMPFPIPRSVPSAFVANELIGMEFAGVGGGCTVVQ